MKSHDIQALLRKYFVFSGLEEKFGSVDLIAPLNKILEKIETDANDEETENLRCMIVVLESWDGEFESLPIYERELEALTTKLLPFDWSQTRILENWPRFSQLNDDTSFQKFSRGVCGGLSRASELSLVLTEGQLLQYFPENIFSRLVNFEEYLKRMATWDGENESREAVKEDFEVFEKVVLSIQKNLYDWQSVLDYVSLNIEVPFNLSFVHNRKTLSYFFNSILQPGKAIYLAASDHAGRIYVTGDNKIIYYNPNERYGFLTFNLENIEHFLYKLAQGFKNVSVEKFSLTVDVCDGHDFEPYPLEFKKIFNELHARQGLVNMQGSNCETALYMACYDNNVEQVALLIELGADPNLTEATKTSPLHLAAMRGNLDIANLLLSIKKIKINSIDKKGYTPLDWALGLNHFPVAQALFLAGADIKRLPMMRRWKLFDYLITQSSDESGVLLSAFNKALKKGDLVLDLENEKIINFLEQIVREDNVAALEILIKRQPEIMDFMFSSSEQESDGEKEKEDDADFKCSILHLAMNCGAVQSVKFLLKRCPELSEKADSNGCSAKAWLAYLEKTEENEDIASLFARYAVDARVSKKSLFAQSPLPDSDDEETKEEAKPLVYYPSCTLF